MRGFCLNSVQKSRGTQHGFTLVVALLLLVALSFVGIASLRNVTIQEKTTGSQFARLMSFQESLSVMRGAEQEHSVLLGLESSIAPAARASTADWWTEPRTSAVEAAYWAKDSSWTGTRSVAPADRRNTGFASSWTSEEVANGTEIRHRSCQTSQAVNPALPCRLWVARQTVRTLEPNSGAVSVVQQHYQYLRD
ncbi:MAG: hypothetical protein EAZ43_02200 [Betaproteobacteria bacterium]|nr:MAG: hypothetical protein EAZ43_02200 [Betaproteobacteria bacterium]